ncbi:MAG: hypothetical protein Q4E36_06315 [Bacillota bacterium]|nr:hypothetical protein [Bacillota bacterium]
MKESKKLILEMLKDGRIDEDEALALLDAIEDSTEKAFDSFEDELSAILKSLSKTSKELSVKVKLYLENVDYEDLKEKFASGIEAVIKGIKDIRMNF